MTKKAPKPVLQEMIDCINAGSSADLSDPKAFSGKFPELAGLIQDAIHKDEGFAAVYWARVAADCEMKAGRTDTRHLEFDPSVYGTLAIQALFREYLEWGFRAEARRLLHAVAELNAAGSPLLGALTGSDLQRIRTCPVCGSVFWRGRDDKTACDGCSDVHRQRAHRLRKDIQKAADRNKKATARREILKGVAANPVRRRRSLIEGYTVKDIEEEFALAHTAQSLAALPVGSRTQKPRPAR